MISSSESRRVLIYSHDSFGLGHLRRCREVAHVLVEADERLSVLILSGSPIIGSFDFRSRVDFVRVPGVIKLRNGDYTSLKLYIDVEQTLAMRASIIEHTAKVFDPDLFIVDKEPLGLRGEVETTLRLLKARGTPCILGLRDVMDEPALLQPEWERKQVAPALQNFYDDIWVYGLPQICDPLAGIDLSASVRKRMTYTGYLNRILPDTSAHPQLEKIDSNYLLVTVGDPQSRDWLHPDVVSRGFVALPLLELAPDLVLPDGGGPLRAVARRFEAPPGQPLETLTDRLLGLVRSPRESPESR